jgi:hypothetical protein
MTKDESVELLRKALEPFAKVGKLIDGPFGPALFAEDAMAFQSGCAWTEDGERHTLTWGDFRRAREALSRPSPTPSEDVVETAARAADAFILVSTNDAGLAIRAGNAVREALARLSPSTLRGGGSG